MNFNMQLDRVVKGQLRPYTQEEFLSWLVKEHAGVDIYQKTTPRLLTDKRKITIEDAVGVEGANTKITFARVDGDGDIDDTSLEIYYYNRLNVDNAKVKQLPSYPPVKGGMFDVPVGTVIHKQHIADCLTDLLWVEVTVDNLVLPSESVTLSAKPHMELEVGLKDHPIYTGNVLLIFYSPEDTRPVKTFNLGQVDTEEGSVSTTIESFSTLSLTPPQNNFERDAIRRRARLPRYLGD